MKVEGNAEGVPYGLQLMGVSDKTVKLSWISPERPMATSMISRIIRTSPSIQPVTWAGRISTPIITIPIPGRLVPSQLRVRRWLS